MTIRQIASSKERKASEAVENITTAGRLSEFQRSLNKRLEYEK